MSIYEKTREKQKEYERNTERFLVSANENAKERTCYCMHT